MTQPELNEVRFASFVDTSGDCWIWMGHRDRSGYGKTKGDRRTSWSAHRYAYATFVEVIPPNRQLDHLCRTPACVNPDHLEIVTHAENMRRSGAALKTHCIHGHEYTPENTYYRTSRSGGRRDCRACIRQRVRDYNARKVAA